MEETGFELMPTGFGDKILDLYSAASVPAACLSSAGLRVPNLARAWESQALPSELLQPSKLQDEILASAKAEVGQTEPVPESPAIATSLSP